MGSVGILQPPHQVSVCEVLSQSQSHTVTHSNTPLCNFSRLLLFHHSFGSLICIPDLLWPRFPSFQPNSSIPNPFVAADFRGDGPKRMTKSEMHYPNNKIVWEEISLSRSWWEIQLRAGQGCIHIGEGKGYWPSTREPHSRVCRKCFFECLSV